MKLSKHETESHIHVLANPLGTIIVFVHFYPHNPRFCHLVEIQRGKKIYTPIYFQLKRKKKTTR